MAEQGTQTQRQIPETLDSSKRCITFEGKQLKGTIVWSPLSKHASQRLAQDIEQLLVRAIVQHLDGD